ncbi:hypothetical protein L950_0206470 [Sphingobacterium sp. IITKGP-BTPF85]|nr:hypothetical protein L950_0206470 [Sphingobacterium sp. IITKGP-BTPF85]
MTYLSNKTKETGIRFAIHNHGPEDKLYPNATVIYNLIKDLDANLGMCFDMGHDTRDGQDAIKDLQQYHKRIFDIHLKMSLQQLRKGLPVSLVAESFIFLYL